LIAMNGLLERKYYLINISIQLAEFLLDNNGRTLDVSSRN